MNDKILSFIPKMYLPGSIFFGSQSLSFLKTISNNKRLFVVSSRFNLKNKDLVKQLTDGSGIIFHSGEPSELNIKKIKKLCKGVEIIVGLGGGSVIDLAKIVKRDLGIKMVAIPTTIGSGSEVSRFSLIVDPKTKKKNVINSADLLPEVVIYNPLLFKSIPKQELIYQTIDAFSHAIESLVSKISNPVSDMLSAVAIDYLYEGLEEISHSKINNEVLEKIITASFLAGLAQSSSATGLAHSFAHYFGPKNNIPHSRAVAIFLLDVLELNAKSCDKYKKLNNLKNISEKNFMLKLKRLFNKLDLTKEKIVLKEEILMSSEQIRKDICTLSNPYSPKTEDIVLIIKKHL